MNFVKTSLLYLGIVSVLLESAACTDPAARNNSTRGETVSQIEKNDNDTGRKAGKENVLSGFVPDGYVLIDSLYGDLNKDGIDDCVLLIKGTDSRNVLKDRQGNDVDRNRRGLLILFRKQDRYESVVKNYRCFSSENEDGGVYYPPELSLDIDKGNLYMHYAHGRYGYWKYTFRYQHSDFEMIGYDRSENFGPVINTETSINYMTGKKIVRENTNQNAEGGDEVFVTTVKKINNKPLVRLSDIEDFDELENYSD